MATNRDSPIFRTTQNAAAPFKIQDISIQHGHPLVQHAYSWPLAHADWNMPRMTWHQRCLNCPRTCSPSSSRHSHLHAAGGSSKKIRCFLQNCKASIQPIGVDNISPNCVTRIEQTSYRSIQDEIGRSESEYAFFRSKRDTCAWSCLHCCCTSQLHNWLAIHIG